MIPKKIHYCWFGRGEKSKVIKKCMESWREHNPDYEIIEWNEDNVDVNSHPFPKAAYAAKKWAFVADYFRLKILYDHGGIYLDTDMMVNKPFDCLLEHKAFFPTYLLEGGVSAGIIGAVKCTNIIERLLREYDLLNYEERNTSLVNPLIFTNILSNEYGFKKAIKKVELPENIVVYPPNILHLNIHDNENICEHLSENSWFKAEKPSYYLELQRYFLDLDKEAGNYIGNIYFDNGEGLSENNKQTVYINKDTLVFQWKGQLDKSVKCIRVDPIEGYFCYIKDFVILHNNSKLKYNLVNGFNDNNYIFFDSKDPQIFVELSELNKFKNNEINITCKVFPLEDNIYKENNSIIKQKNTEIDSIIKQKNTEIDSIIKQKNTEIDSIINSRSWRITKPLRSFANFVRKHKALRLFAKGLLSLKRVGIVGTIRKINEYRKDKKLSYIFKDDIYYIGNKILEDQQNESASLDIQKEIEQFKIKPLISVIMPLYNSPVKWLKIAIQSLQAQTYTNWELCAVDDGSKKIKHIKLIKKMAKNDIRIRLIANKVNSGISSASNKAIEFAKGEYIALMDHDDELTKDALYWIVKEINEYPDTDFIYSDECKIDCNTNKKYDFHFKPNWSPALLLNFMYIMHLTVYRTSLVRKIGGFRCKYDFSQDYDLALRMGDVAKNIRHIERVLYYWRNIPGSAASGSKNFARETNMAALKDWYMQNGINVLVLDNDKLNEARPEIKDMHKISIIIPSDNFINIKQCIYDLIENTSYLYYEIIIVTNTIIAKLLLQEFLTLENLIIHIYDKPFNFSDKCNEGVSVASGDVLCFYNDDVLPLKKDWIQRMLDILILPGVGGVSPIQLTDKNKVLNAGMILGVAGIQTFAYDGMDFYNSRNLLHTLHMIHEITIMPGSCFLIKTDIFKKINGFDAVNTPNAFSDTDISLRLIENGYRCVCTPYALMHHDNNVSWTKKNIADKSYLYVIDQWGKYIANEKYFSDSLKKLYENHSKLYKDIPMYHYYSPNNPITRKTGGRDILFITHELSRTGAPIVLLDMIKVILENGDWPVIVSLSDGPLKQEFLNMGITVIIDRLFIFEHIARNFDLIVVNTIVCAEVISILGNSLPPVLWWIHESPMLVLLLENKIPKKLDDNIYTYAGSKYTAHNLNKAGLNYKFNILLYGVPDMLPTVENNKNYNSRTLFITFGTIELRKGQDILLNAIENLSDIYKEKAKFIFIGNNNNDIIYDKIIELSQRNNYIEYYEVIPREELHNWYLQADCLILPSREDPLPVVAIESMIFSTPVICSDGTGTADFISNNINGFVFPNENHKSLTELIIFAIENREKMTDIGRKARKEIYEKYFTMEIFKNNTLQIVNELIQKAKKQEK